MNTPRYARIGLFFLLLGGAGTFYIVLTTNGFSFFNTVSYEAVMHDATGLSTRSRVYMAGVPVGKVNAISLEGSSARLRLGILRDVEIREDARLSRRPSSILGTSMLSLEPGSYSAALLPPGGSIHAGGEGADMMNIAARLGTDISGVLREFQETHMALLAVSLETFNSIASQINERTGDELDRVSRILESAAQITERTERIMAAREEDISLSLLEIRLAMENIRAISGQIAEGRGNLGQAIYDDRLYNSLLSTVEETEKAVVKLQTVLDGAGDFMGRVNGTGILVDSSAAYGFNSGHVRAGASLRLEPASGDRWYRIGVNGAPEGVSARTVTVTSGTVTGYEDRTETKYSFSVDAELARRFGILTLRGGLLESTAGVGVDLQPVRWAALSGEVFNFRSGFWPNLRGTLTVYPFFNPGADNPLNWIYLKGGVYNALDANRDFFLGGGVRFSDREIKSLVGLAAAAAAGP
ncbi:MAG: MlaD family protein [Treponema sp.]|jgi:phospholipid/cholesterol/gamma-HCH transport system substrate-binding protein|nr:MlaD family protein [Treponema sp.]